MIKKFTKFLLFANILLIPFFSYGQGNNCELQKWEWAKNIASEEYQLSTKIAYDQRNNLYIAGYFSNFVDLGDTTLTANGSAGYLAKYSSSGVLLWSKVEKNLAVRSILIEGEKIYTSFSEISGMNLMGISQYDLAGDLQWTEVFENAMFFGITADEMGNIYMGGNFYGSIQFDNEILISESEFGDAFVSKFSANGDFNWARQVSYLITGDIAVNSKGEVYAAGILDGTVNFAGDTLNLYNGSYGGGALFKFSPDGDEMISEYVAKAPVYSSLTSLAIDKEDNIIVGGYFESTNTSEDDTATTKIGTNKYTLNSSFVAKYNNLEEFQWSGKVTDFSQTIVSDIEIDSNNNIYLAENNFVNHELSIYDAFGNKTADISISSIDGTYGTEFDIDLSPDDGLIAVSGAYNQQTQFGDVTVTPEDPGNTYLAQLNLSATLPSPQISSATIELSEQSNSSVHLSWENGDGNGRLVLLKKLGKVSPSNIEDGIIYNGGAGEFGLGTQTGEREFVVYVGSGSEVTITGLQKGRPYQVAVIEYNDSTECPDQINYLQEDVAKKIFVTSGGGGLFSAYPNPLIQDILTVQLPDDVSEEDLISLSDAYGKKILQRKIKNFARHSGEVQINMESLRLQPGIYFLSLTGQPTIRLIQQ